MKIRYWILIWALITIACIPNALLQGRRAYLNNEKHEQMQSQIDKLSTQLEQTK